MRKGSDGGNGKKNLGKNRKKKERKKKRLMKIMATTSFASRTTTDGTPHAHAKKKLLVWKNVPKKKSVTADIMPIWTNVAWTYVS